jgi:hypothetical protein
VDPETGDAVVQQTTVVQDAETGEYVVDTQTAVQDGETGEVLEVETVETGYE